MARRNLKFPNGCECAVCKERVKVIAFLPASNIDYVCKCGKIAHYLQDKEPQCIMCMTQKVWLWANRYD